MNQVGGVNLVAYYTPLILRTNVDLSENLANISRFHSILHDGIRYIIVFRQYGSEANKDNRFIRLGFFEVNYHNLVAI